MTDTAKTTGRWRNWLLIASLALNLAIIGFLAGTALRGHGHNPGKLPQPDLLRELVRAVPKDHRDALRKDFGDKRTEMQRFRSDMRHQRQDLVKILVNPEFKISQVVTFFEDHRVILSRITTGGQNIIIRRIEAMSDEERKEFAANLANHQKKRRKPK